MKKVFVGFFFALFYLPGLAQGTDSSIISAMNGIEYGYFFKHLKYLSSDELKGRYVGSEGYNKAADYIAEEFKEIGLQPFGDSGSYFQKLVFLKPCFKVNTVKFKVENGSRAVEGIYGKNVSILANVKSENFSENQKLVFVGYGNIIPEERINDYEGLDVKGKTVIVAIGGPEKVQNAAFDDILLKAHNAESQGAAGIVLFYPQGKLIQNLIFKYAHSFLEKSPLYYADTSIHGSMLDVNLTMCAYAKLSFIEEVFKLNGFNFKKVLKSIKAGKNMSKEFGSILSCAYNVNIDRVLSKNVVSVIPGTDSVLKNEYVVVGSHLDHLGIGEKIKGDSIYNGMVDNASGCAALLCIGKAFKQLPQKPKRSIIFICYTAEEEGQFGSCYFVNKNGIRNGRIAANLNLDMIANLFESKNIFPVGYLHSNLSEAVDYATSNLSLAVSATKAVDEAYVERGDQFSFIKKGIPSLFIIPGNTAVDPKINGYKRTTHWLKKYYHSPFDEINQPYSDKAFLTGTRLNFLTLYYITNRLDSIKWNSRSWFIDKYVSGSKK